MPESLIRAIRRAFTLVAATLLVLLGALPADSSGAAPVSALQFDHLVFKGAGGEPDMAISPSGRVMLVGGLGPDKPAALYRSTNSGKTFTKLSPSFSRVGGEDWDMYLLDDHTVVAADDTIGHGIYVHRSTDAGLHWTTTTIETDQYDRPWLDHFGRDLVYVVAKGFDGLPYLFRSTDGGASFGAPPIPLIVYGEPGSGGPDPATGLFANQNGYVDHLVVDHRTGDVYVLYGIGAPSSYNTSQPLGASNQLYVAHLEQGRFVSHAVYLGGPGDSFISGFNWMTVDRAGTVYVLCDGRINGHHSARLSYSKNHGRTWSNLVDIAPPGAANVYGAISAASPGVLALAYIRGSNEDPSTPQPWFAEMARVTGADTPSPKVNKVRAVAQPIHLEDICFDGILCGLPGFGNDRNLLDFIWVSVDPSGRSFGVFASDGPATGNSSGQTPDVILLRQTSGTTLPGPAPAPKLKVLATKTTRSRSLAATGVGDGTVVGGALLAALAAGLAGRLRRFR